MNIAKIMLIYWKATLSALGLFRSPFVEHSLRRRPNSKELGLIYMTPKIDNSSPGHLYFREVRGGCDFQSKIICLAVGQTLYNTPLEY